MDLKNDTLINNSYIRQNCIAVISLHFKALRAEQHNNQKI